MKTLAEWNQGYPEKVGLYLIKVNGLERLGLHKVCTINGKHRWMTPNGYDITGAVEWTGEVLTPDLVPSILDRIEAQKKKNDEGESRVD